MTMNKDLEKAAENVTVVSGDDRGGVDTMNPIPSANKTILTPGLESAPDHESTPSNPENAIKLQIDHLLAEIERDEEAIILNDSSRATSRILKGVYERNLQVCVAVVLKDYMRSKEDPSIEKWGVLQASVRAHANALRDFQTLLEFEKTRESPNQLLDVSKKLARLDAYESTLGLDRTFLDDARKDVYGSYPYAGPREKWLQVSDDIETTLNAEITRVEEGASAFRQRFLAALFGGYVLLIPMLIMTLSPTLITALLTTTLCVLGVVVFVAIGFNTAEPKDVLSIAAGYAAVLVVFIGTSTPTETMKRGIVAIIVVGVLIGSTALSFLFGYLFEYRRLKMYRRRLLQYRENRRVNL